jgi:hypothetical protein
MKQCEQALQNPQVYYPHMLSTTIQNLYRTVHRMANTSSASTEAKTAFGLI